MSLNWEFRTYLGACDLKDKCQRLIGAALELETYLGGNERRDASAEDERHLDGYDSVSRCGPKQ